MQATATKVPMTAAPLSLLRPSAPRLGMRKIYQKRRSRGMIIQGKQVHFQPKPAGYEALPKSLFSPKSPLQALTQSPRAGAHALLGEVDWEKFKSGDSTISGGVGASASSSTSTSPQQADAAQAEAAAARQRFAENQAVFQGLDLAEKAEVLKTRTRMKAHGVGTGGRGTAMTARKAFEFLTQTQEGADVEARLRGAGVFGGNVEETGASASASEEFFHQCDENPNREMQTRVVNVHRDGTSTAAPREILVPARGRAAEGPGQGPPPNSGVRWHQQANAWVCQVSRSNPRKNFRINVKAYFKAEEWGFSEGKERAIAYRRGLLQEWADLQRAWSILDKRHALKGVEERIERFGARARASRCRAGEEERAEESTSTASDSSDTSDAFTVLEGGRLVERELGGRSNGVGVVAHEDVTQHYTGAESRATTAPTSEEQGAAAVGTGEWGGAPRKDMDEGVLGIGR